jgi:hypothetical protein
LSADGPWQEIPDGHPGSIGSVENHRIALLELRLHGVAARNEAAPGNGATEFPGVDKDVDPTALGGATQLSEQFLPEVIGRNHCGLQPHHAPDSSR